jgi:hypothetical protein
MKHFRTIGLALLALLALGAFAASAASAEEGFLPLTNKKATVVGKKATFTAGALAISCTVIDLALSPVTFANDKHGTGTLHFLKCTSAGLAANSLGDGKEEILVPGEFLVCLEPKNAAGKVLGEFGIAVEVSKIHLEVPSIAQLIEINGLVIGVVLAKAGEKLKNFKIDFVAPEKKQEAVSCIEGKNVKKHTLAAETNHAGGPVEGTEAVEGGELEFEEAQELMDS